MRKALIFTGPGFAPQEDLKQNLILKQFQVDECLISVHPDYSQVKLQAEYDLVILRAPWSAVPEEMMLTNLLTEILKPILQPKSGKSLGKKTIGIGRGALILFNLFQLAPGPLYQLQWKEAFKNSGPWLKSEYYKNPSDSPSRILCQVSGRALPDWDGAQAGGCGAWIKCEKKVVGWKNAKGLYFSFLDPFTFADRSQHPDYGYYDLHDLLTQAEVIDLILDTP